MKIEIEGPGVSRIAIANFASLCLALSSRDSNIGILASGGRLVGDDEGQRLIDRLRGYPSLAVIVNRLCESTKMNRTMLLAQDLDWIGKEVERIPADEAKCRTIAVEADFLLELLERMESAADDLDFAGGSMCKSGGHLKATERLKNVLRTAGIATGNSP